MRVLPRLILAVPLAAVVLLGAPSCSRDAPAPAAPSAPEPAQVRRWIAWPDVAVVPTRSGGVSTGRLAAGTVVQVVIDREMARVVGARFAGWVPTAALSTRPVTAKDLDATLAAALRALDEREALRVAEAMLVLQPDHAAALEVVGALVAGTDWQRSRALLAKRGPHPTTTLPDEPTTTAGQRSYVAASSLKLRGTAAKEGKLIADLPIGTALDVLSVDGEWAHVRWTPTTKAVAIFPRGLLQHEVGAAELIDVNPVEAFVATRFLSSTAPTPATLRAKATAATEPAVRSAWWQRALALEPCDESLRRTAADAAVVAGLFFDAAHDARRGTCATATPSASAAVRVWAGCRGGPARATTTTYDAPLPSADAVPALCVEAFVREPPCNASPAHDAAIEVSRELEALFDELGLPWDAKPQGPRAADIARLQANATAAWQEANEVYAAASAHHVAAVAAVDAAVGNAPWLEVVLPASPSLWLAVQTAQLQGCDPPTPVSETIPDVFRLSPLPAGPVRAFVPLPVANGAFVGIVDAPDAESARSVFAAASVVGDSARAEAVHANAGRAPASTAGSVVLSTVLPLAYDCEGCSCWH